jgi:UDP-N-acetylglucosamine--N-acetylmuramyl-(pentapeptide) pyrophosphoryl-undecaprenol N-acetylglucosamine transferase
MLLFEIMRLLFSCVELGLGHVSRVIALGKRLEKRGNELFFFSGGTAYQLLKKEFKNVLPCTPVAWYESAHGIDVSISLLNILVPLPHYHYEKNRFEIKSSNAMETIHRYYDLRKHIYEIKPDLIVSDSDMHALRLAHRWKIPSVYITNIIRPNYNFSPLLIPGERFTERYVKNSSRIVVPDNPSPYTICEHNLGDLNQIGIRDKVKFVGAFLDMTPTEGSEEYVFAPISGPLGTRAKLKQTIIPVLKKLEIKSIISLGVPGEKIHAKVGNCEIHSWLSPQERHEYMKNSKMVVFSGGHITYLETVKYVKPSICIPTQSEQVGNARKMQDLNCSIVVKNGKQLRLAIEKIEEKKQFYKSNVKALNLYANKFNGLENAVAVIEDLVKT